MLHDSDDVNIFPIANSHLLQLQSLLRENDPEGSHYLEYPVAHLRQCCSSSFSLITIFIPWPPKYIGRSYQKWEANRLTKLQCFICIVNRTKFRIRALPTPSINVENLTAILCQVQCLKACSDYLDSVFLQLFGQFSEQSDHLAVRWHQVDSHVKWSRKYVSQKTGLKVKLICNIKVSRKPSLGLQLIMMVS